MTSASLLQRFLDFVTTGNLFNKNNRLLVAVSGGLDSVVLCHLCQQSGFTFAMAHCNFGLRGMESDRDETFVRDHAGSYGVPLFVRRFNTENFAREEKLSIQEAARKLRYQWFSSMIETKDSKGNAVLQSNSMQQAIPGAESWKDNPDDFAPQLLLTAHHLDDNIETVAMHFLKGTGISGLRGMLPKQNQLVRPLLFARRSELEAYAKEMGLQWVEDSSNASTKYTRNFFRHEVLPLIEQKIPGAMENIAAAIPRFADAEVLYRQAVDLHKKKLLEYKGAEVHIPVLKLEQAEARGTLVYEIIKPFGFSPAQTADVLHLLQSDSGRFVRSATHQVLRHRKWLVIAPLNSDQQNLVVITTASDPVHYGGGKLQIQEQPVPGNLVAPVTTALLDAKELAFPLVLRRWKAGDYFYPLGLRKKKKISRFLIDLKLSKVEKEAVWVLESNKKIAWVVGRRIDDRFKVTAATQAVVRITSSPYSEGTFAPRG